MPTTIYGRLYLPKTQWNPRLEYDITNYDLIVWTITSIFIKECFNGFALTRHYIIPLFISCLSFWFISLLNVIAAVESLMSTKPLTERLKDSDGCPECIKQWLDRVEDLLGVDDPVAYIVGLGVVCLLCLLFSFGMFAARATNATRENITLEEMSVKPDPQRKRPETKREAKARRKREKREAQEAALQGAAEEPEVIAESSKHAEASRQDSVLQNTPHASPRASTTGLFPITGMGSLPSHNGHSEMANQALIDQFDGKDVNDSGLDFVLDLIKLPEYLYKGLRGLHHFGYVNAARMAKYAALYFYIEIHINWLLWWGETWYEHEPREFEKFENRLYKIYERDMEALRNWYRGGIRLPKPTQTRATQPTPKPKAKPESNRTPASAPEATSRPEPDQPTQDEHDDDDEPLLFKGRVALPKRTNSPKNPVSKPTVNSGLKRTNAPTNSASRPTVNSGLKRTNPPQNPASKPTVSSRLRDSNWASPTQEPEAESVKDAQKGSGNEPAEDSSDAEKERQLAVEMVKRYMNTEPGKKWKGKAKEEVNWTGDGRNNGSGSGRD